VRVVPDYSDLVSYGATIQSLWGITLIGLRDPAISDFERFAKRLLDLFLSGLGLLLLSPLMAMTAIAIKLESEGPVFYVAPRAGENGRTLEDLYYVQNYSLWLDLRILWKTIAAVVRGNGAY
jgi:lipopolysaccharide/colanic/teichoic acid biosynthesis glycosyltransferase